MPITATKVLLSLSVSPHHNVLKLLSLCHSPEAFLAKQALHLHLAMGELALTGMAKEQAQREPRTLSALAKPAVVTGGARHFAWVSGAPGRGEVACRRLPNRMIRDLFVHSLILLHCSCGCRSLPAPPYPPREQEETCTRGTRQLRRATRSGAWQRLTRDCPRYVEKKQ